MKITNLEYLWNDELDFDNTLTKETTFYKGIKYHVKAFSIRISTQIKAAIVARKYNRMIIALDDHGKYIFSEESYKTTRDYVTYCKDHDLKKIYDAWKEKYISIINEL